MSLYNDLTDVLTPYANKIKEVNESLGDFFQECTDELKEYLYASDAIQNRYYTSATETGYSSSGLIAFSETIPVVAGRTYYYKNINPRLSWYLYEDQTTNYLVNDNTIRNGTFIPEQDGIVVVTSNSSHVNDAIFTDSQDVYDAGIQKSILIIKTDSTLTSEKEPANAKVVGDILASAITGTNIEIENYNIYDDAEIVTGKYISSNGVISASGSGNTKLAKVPVESGKIYKILYAGYTGQFNATRIGAIDFLVNETVSSYIINFDKNTYGDDTYITVSIPDGCNVLAFTVVLPSSSLDIEASCIVCEARCDFSEIDSISGIKSILNKNLIDEYARSRLEGATKNILTGKKIVAIGDSITQQTYWAVTGWLKHIQQWTGCAVQNLGSSGCGFVASSSHYLNSINNIDSDVAIIGVACSFNDMTPNIPTGDVTDTGTASRCGYVNDFFDALLTAFPTTPIICYVEGPWGNYHYGIEKSDDFVEKVGIICKKKGIAFYDGLYTNGCVLRPWIQANAEIYFKCDDSTSQYYENVNTIHPNSIGHIAIAHYLMSKFEEHVVSDEKI